MGKKATLWAPQVRYPAPSTVSGWGDLVDPRCVRPRVVEELVDSAICVPLRVPQQLDRALCAATHSEVERIAKQAFARSRRWGASSRVVEGVFGT
jgi:hypothetical protein